MMRKHLPLEVHSPEYLCKEGAQSTNLPTADYLPIQAPP